MEIGGITVSEKQFDVVIVGGGGSGLRASLEISKSGLDVAIVGLEKSPKADLKNLVLTLREYESNGEEGHDGYQLVWRGE